jgi:putative flippase GtrA
MNPAAPPSRLQRPKARVELAVAAQHAGVSLVGFAVDFGILHAAMRAGLEPAWARVVSLALAVQATFLLNTAYVFRCLRWEPRLARRWAAYMVSNGFGNLCNYWIFVTLVSLHHPPVSRPTVALCIAALTAWVINYAAARLLVYGDALRHRLAERGRRADGLRRATRGGPSPAGPESSRR